MRASDLWHAHCGARAVSPAHDQIASIPDAYPLALLQGTVVVCLGVAVAAGGARVLLVGTQNVVDPPSGVTIHGHGLPPC